MFDDFDFDIDFEKLFEEKDPEPEKPAFKLENSFIRIKHIVETHDVMVSNAKAFAEKITLKENMAVYATINGRFIFGDFITEWIIARRLQVEELTIISLSTNVSITEGFLCLLNGGMVDKINLLLSNYFFRTEMKKQTQTIKYLAELSEKYKGRFNLFFTETHEKFTLLKTRNNYKFVMHGSANLRSSESIEGLVVEESEKLYDWKYKYFNNLIAAGEKVNSFYTDENKNKIKSKVLTKKR